jgi:methionine biosynthesis protein MetW
LLVGGRMPMTSTLPDQWYNTPNIHLCTLLDFVDLCKSMNVRIEQGFALNAQGQKMSLDATGGLANVFSDQAVFVLTRDA